MSRCKRCAPATDTQEFEHAPDDTRIYKRMGPVLMPQETDEAKANVAKRIEFIKTELYVGAPLTF